MRRAVGALDAVGAGPLADSRARTLSGGETRRVAIARALLLAPRALLLDEPLSAADRVAREALGRVIDRLRTLGTTVCFSSHQLEDAYRWSTRLFTLVEGRLDGVTPENLLRADLPPGSGSRTVQAGPLALTVVTERVWPATVAIPPEDIIVSRAPLESSARIQFEGRVSAIAEGLGSRCPWSFSKALWQERHMSRGEREAIAGFTSWAVWQAAQSGGRTVAVGFDMP